MPRRITAALLTLAAGLGTLTLTTTHSHADTATGDHACIDYNWPPELCQGPKGPWEWD